MTGYCTRSTLGNAECALHRQSTRRALNCRAKFSKRTAGDTKKAVTQVLTELKLTPISIATSAAERCDTSGRVGHYRGSYNDASCIHVAFQRRRRSWRQRCKYGSHAVPSSCCDKANRGTKCPSRAFPALLNNIVREPRPRAKDERIVEVQLIPLLKAPCCSV